MSKKKMAGSFCSPWLSRTRMYALLLLFFMADLLICACFWINALIIVFSLCIFSKIKFSSLFVQKNIYSGETKFSSE
ncbi:hypothetical protein GGQ57_001479 [Parabacteroides faecis]|uniref:Uncharacterized protein n=1 Tax=Parabacteroides faecis TaxID=1217282 RepID=A0ABR6KJ93_9BACT|nr:hypothetical protein [Parabacteroides faecis]